MLALRMGKKSSSQKFLSCKQFGLPKNKNKTG